MAVILTVDQDARIRDLLGAYLSRDGHRLVAAGTGERAVELAAESAPDLVLLDLVLPGIDGFETTRRLKHQAGSEYLPVIVVTAVDDVEARVAGYRAGADQFLTKPVHRAELLSRVDNLLALREERRAIARSHAELVQLQRYKEDLTQLVVHDLKNPLSALAANLEYARQEMRMEARPDVLDSIDDSLTACTRLQRMVVNLLDVGRLEEGRLELRPSRIAFRPLILALTRSYARAAQERSVRLEAESDTDTELEADADLICRVVENLIENALRLTPRGGRVSVSAATVDGAVQLRVAGSGPLVPSGLRAAVFEKYGIVGPAEEGGPRPSRGLGLYFCRLAVEAHGGRVFVEDEADRAAFVIELPAASGKRPALASGNR